MSESNVPNMIDILVQNAERYPRITPEERDDYVRRARAGDTTARDTIYANYTAAVIAIARNRYNHIKELPAVSVTLEDLIQEGLQGIQIAIDRYRPDNDGEAGFTTYVFKRIGYCINDYITDNGRLLRLSKARITQMRFIYAAQEALEAQLGRTPTSQEVSAAINGRFSASEIDNIQDLMENSYAVSIHGSSDDPEEGSLEDTLSDPENFVEDVLQEELVKDLYRHLDALDRSERIVITQLFGLEGGQPKTLTQIAKVLYAEGITGYTGAQLTKEGVRRISDRALRKLHTKLRAYANDFNY